MISRIPFERVNWTSSAFLTVTFFGAVIGTPAYFIHFGVDPFLIGLFFLWFCLTGISITLGYHRLFSHRSFQAKAPVKLFTLLFGAAAFEDSALDWASDHRQHHKHTDHDEDPYDISKGFFWAHIGWIFFKLYPRPLANVADLKKDPLVMWQHRWHRVIAMAVGLVLPAAIGFLWNSWEGALGGFLLGGITRLVCVQHCTFFINSLCHTMGNRPYDSRTSARDSFIMALLTFGEGYHNYHHSFQHDYRNGVRKWHFDPTKWTIWTLEKFGLTSDLKRVPREKIALAELREAQRVAEYRLENLKATRLSENGETCPQWKRTLESLREAAEKLSHNHTALEDAVSRGAKISRSVLRRWKAEAAAYLDRLGSELEASTA